MVDFTKLAAAGTTDDLLNRLRNAEEALADPDAFVGMRRKINILSALTGAGKDPRSDDEVKESLTGMVVAIKAELASRNVIHANATIN